MDNNRDNWRILRTEQVREKPRNAINPDATREQKPPPSKVSNKARDRVKDCCYFTH